MDRLRSDSEPLPSPAAFSAPSGSLSKGTGLLVWEGGSKECCGVAWEEKMGRWQQPPEGTWHERAFFSLLGPGVGQPGL